MENMNITDAGMVLDAGNVQMSAQNIAGRDQYFYEEYYNVGAKKFVSINVDSYNKENYIVPQFRDELLERIGTTGLLLLTGSFEFDKSSFIRHIACSLRESFPYLKIMEYSPSEEKTVDLFRELMDQGDPSVFIMNKISAKDIGFDLDRVKRAAEQQKHFVLLSSDIQLGMWNLPRHAVEKYCFEIPDHDLYSRNVIAEVLISEIEKNKPVLQLDIPSGTIDSLTKLTEKHDVNTLVSLLKTPEHAVLFVETLSMSNRLIDAERMEEVINEFKDKKESIITKWFKNLEPKEKMIALGASLFQGVYEDQFFELMQSITEDFWHLRTPELKALDYEDLDFMMNFFKLEDRGASVCMFKGKFPNQRADIIKTIWNSHRRHLMAALPVLTRIGNTSRNTRNITADMYNTRERRMKLRGVIAEILSDIGMVSVMTVEESLLQFAAVGDERVQRLTAKAMARWREYGKESLLFETLQRWEEDDIIQKITDSVDSNENMRAVYVKGTILLTLGYAAEYDSPGQLRQEIIDQVISMVRKRNGYLNTSLKKILNPMIINHYTQLKDVLPDEFMIHNDFEQSLIEGVCEIYKKDGFQVKNYIDYWRDSCVEDSSRDNRRRKPTYRDQILICLLRIYQKLPYNDPGPVISLEEVWSLLQQLYQTEERPAVRSVILETVGVFISIDPAFALSQLEQLFTYANLQEREAVLSSLAAIYIGQRKGLEGAEHRVKVRGEWFPSFVYQTRPLTPIEQAMYEWLNSDNAFAQQLSLLAFMQFAKEFDVEENQTAPEPISKPKAASANDTRVNESMVASRGPRVVTLYKLQLTFWDMIRIWWWMLFESPENRELIRNLQTTMLQHYTLFGRSHIMYVMNKMNRRSEKRLNRLGKWLNRWFTKIIW